MFKKFIRDKRGNVAAMFGFLVVPMVAATGMAIDYGRATATRTALQNAIDASALMVSTDVKRQPTMSSTDVQTKARQYFNAEFKGRFAFNINVTASYTPASIQTAGLSKINIAATADVNTTVARVIGPDFMRVASDAEIVWGIKRLEVALALDNTGSMASSNKLVELKTAVRNMMDSLYKAAQKPGDVKVAIIPFATDVNIGTSNINASWLDWSQWEADNQVCTRYNSRGQCTATAPAARSTWNGCIWDRDQPNDTLDTTPVAGNSATLFEPHQSSWCPASMLPLTDILSLNAWTSLDVNNTTAPLSILGQKINSMTPTGNTNVTIGMAWGWHALTQNLPLPEASVPATDLDKIVILLTDGDNTQNRFSTNQTSIDARTALACSNAKAAGIKIYTVRVIDGDADLLRACANDPSYYYEAQNAAQIGQIFTMITNRLVNLRISK